LDQNVNIKVVEHQKLSNFYIGGFSCSVDKFGLFAKSSMNTMWLTLNFSRIRSPLELCIS
jgi:hypothetical protein